MEGKKNSGLSIGAFILSLLGCTGLIGLILAIVDLAAGKNDGKKHGFSKAAIVLFGVWILLGIIAGMASGDSSGGKVTTEASAKEQTQEKTEKQQEDASSESGRDSNIHVGEAYENGGLLISYDAVETDYKSSNEYMQPAEGKKYVAATFTYTNNSDSDSQYASIYDFDCYADDASCEQAYLAEDDFINTNLSPGRKVTFTVYFEVPQDSKVIELEYSGNVWSTDVDAVFLISE